MAEESYPLLPAPTSVGNNNQINTHITANVVVMGPGQANLSDANTTYALNVGAGSQLERGPSNSGESNAVEHSSQNRDSSNPETSRSSYERLQLQLGPSTSRESGTMDHSFRNRDSSNPSRQTSSNQVCKLEQKKQFLLNFLESKFKSSKGNQLIYVLTAIYETNDHQLVGTHFKDIDLSGQSIDENGADLLSSVISGMESIESINLSGCGMEDRLLEIMGENMKDSGLQIGKVNLMTKLTNVTNRGLASLAKHIKVDTIMVNIEENRDLDVSEIFEFASTNVSTVTDTVTTVRRENSSEAVVSHEHATGTFLLKDKFFAVNATGDSQLINSILDIERFLKPLRTRMEKELEWKQFVTWSAWKNLQNSRISDKIPDILIDLRVEDNVESSLILPCVRRFEIKMLDVVVRRGYSFTTGEELKSLKQELSQNGCDFAIHWRFSVRSKKEVSEIIPTLQHNQAENLRLWLVYPASRDEIQSLVEKCNLKTLTIGPIEECKFGRWRSNEEGLALTTGEWLGRTLATRHSNHCESWKNADSPSEYRKRRCTKLFESMRGRLAPFLLSFLILSLYIVAIYVPGNCKHRELGPNGTKCELSSYVIRGPQ